MRLHFPLAFCVILVHVACAQTSNLRSFFFKDSKGVPHSGYVEPPSEGTKTKARILVFPTTSVSRRNVILEGRNGEDVSSLAQLSNRGIRGRISVQLNVTELASDAEAARMLMKILHPEILQNSGGVTSPPQQLNFPRPEGKTRADQAQIDHLRSMLVGGQYQEAALYSHFARGCAEKLAQYSIVPVFPKSVAFSVLVNGEVIAMKHLPIGSSIESGSIFDIPIKPDLDVSTYRNLLEGDFLVQTEFQYLSSRFQAANASIDLRGHNKYLLDAFRRSVSRSSSTSTGVVFWKNTQHSIRNFVQDRSNESLSGNIEQSLDYRLYDVDDQNLVQQVERFLFPEITLDQLIADHSAALIQARDDDNEELIRTHRIYTELLINKKETGSMGSQIDAAKALVALSDKNMASFLSQGFAFGIEGSSGAYTYRKITNREFSQSETRRFNSLIFKSLFQNHLISQRPSM